LIINDLRSNWHEIRYMVRMSSTTPYLPGFIHQLCGRPARTQASRAASRAASLDGLATLVAKFIPAELFAPVGDQRDRVYSSWVTFIAFLGQVLTRGSACREAVRRVQAWCVADRGRVPSSNDSAYCQARKRLGLDRLRAAHEAIGGWIDQRADDAQRWCGRSVKVIDGSGISMPDTAENRARFPYASGQKPGCGFPTGQLVGLFCLATGRMVRFAIESWKAHEIPLARLLISWVEPGDILLADRGFCGWGLIALLWRKKVDVVMRAHQARKLKGDRMTWKIPQRKTETWDKALWSELPEELVMRIVRFRVSVPGFRTQEIVLVTTLLDTEAYPDSELARLYLRRWRIELFFRDIKTTLGLDVLRCETPDMVEKEIWMQALAYNLIRALMLEAALTHNVDLTRLSFKGTVDTLRQWTPLFAPKMFTSKRARAELLRIIAADQIPERPNRSEPRAKKRRPKPYQLLTKPRHQMIVSESRRRKQLRLT
jgi:hypothetical protein